MSLINFFLVMNKHIRLRHDVVKQLPKDAIVSIDHVKSKVNMVDPLTKPLGKKLMNETSGAIRLEPI